MEMSKTGGSYTLGPAERLLPVLEAGQSGYRAVLESLTPTSVLVPLWHDELTVGGRKYPRSSLSYFEATNVFSWSPRITRALTHSPF